MVLVANFSNIRCKIPKLMVVGNATCNPKLIMPLRPDLGLVAHDDKLLVLAEQDYPKIPEIKPTSN